jgi:glycosyltransferase involved in cell wall biosynthesis
MDSEQSKQRGYLLSVENLPAVIEQNYEWSSEGVSIRRAFPRLSILTSRKSPLEKSLDTFTANLMGVTKGVEFDLCHAVDLLSLIPAVSLKKRTKAACVLDFNEFPVFKLRAGKVFRNMSKTHLNHLDARMRILVNSVDGAISYSRGVGKIAAKEYGITSSPILNLHNNINLDNNYSIRSDFGLKNYHRVLVHNCGYANEYGSAIIPEILAKLPIEYHIVMVGSAMSKAFDDNFKEKAAKLGVENRLHFKEDISGTKEYLSYLQGANLGLVILDSKVPNIRFGFSNRFCDLVAAGLPIITTSMPEANAQISHFKNGKVIQGFSVKTFVTAIREIAEDENQFELWRRAALCRESFSWSGETEKYNAIIDNVTKKQQNRNVAMIFPRGLVKNHRVFRLAKSIAKDGNKVAIFCGTEPPDKMRDAYPEVGVFRLSMKRALSNKEIQKSLDRIKQFYN